MGSRVDVDIDELERFANQLRQFNAELEQITYRVDGQLRALGSSWRDDQYGKFEEEWHAAYLAINKYLDQEAPRYVQSLLIKAAKLRDARG